MRNLLLLSLTLFLTACANQAQQTENQPTEPAIESTAGMTKDNPAMSENDIQLSAQGNEPFWAVTFTATRMELSGLDIDTLSVPLPPEITRPADANTYAYRARTRMGDLFVELSPENCDDTMADRSYPFSARVQVKRAGEADYTTYIGCADYPEGHQPLAGEWRVASIDGAAMAEGPQQPTIAFNSDDGQVSGSTGCNRFNGTFTFQKDANELTFGPLATTRKMCRGDNPEQAFLAVMNAQPLKVVALPGRAFIRGNSGSRMELSR